MGPIELDWITFIGFLFGGICFLVSLRAFIRMETNRALIDRKEIRERVANKFRS